MIPAALINRRYTPEDVVSTVTLRDFGEASGILAADIVTYSGGKIVC